METALKKTRTPFSFLQMSGFFLQMSGNIDQNAGGVAPGARVLRTRFEVSHLVFESKERLTLRQATFPRMRATHKVLDRFTDQERILPTNAAKPE